jgi:peptidoglycan/LPS O-acetylase OafA/YrhL
MRTPRREHGFIAELDGLRGIAILLVMVYRFWPRSDVGLGLDLARAGWIGVDLFFVISGFLITRILLATKGDPTYFRDFYVRRVLRIFPLYYLFVGSVLLLFAWDPAYRAHSGSPLWYLLYLGNVPTSLLGLDIPYWLGTVWSLAVEEQFYLTFPWLVALLNRRRLSMLLLALLVIAPALRLVTMMINPGYERLQYSFTLCRVDTIAIGCLLAILTDAIDLERYRSRLRSVALVMVTGAVIVAAATGLGHSTMFERVAGFSIVALGWASVIMLAVLARGTRSTAMLRDARLRYFGTLCFGLYLLHRPADTFVSAVVGRAGIDTAALWLIPVKIAAAVGLATLSWHMLERPILGLKSAFGGIRHPGHGALAIESAGDLPILARAFRRVALRLGAMIPLSERVELPALTACERNAHERPR